MIKKETVKLSYYENKLGTKVYFFKDINAKDFVRVIYKDGKIKEFFIKNKKSYSLGLRDKGYLKKIELKNN